VPQAGWFLMNDQAGSNGREGKRRVDHLEASVYRST
jgi:hypothetical protein